MSEITSSYSTHYGVAPSKPENNCRYQNPSTVTVQAVKSNKLIATLDELESKKVYIAACVPYIKKQTVGEDPNEIFLLVTGGDYYTKHILRFFNSVDHLNAMD
jgi:hypothetical protein